MQRHEYRNTSFKRIATQYSLFNQGTYQKKVWELVEFWHLLRIAC